MTTTPSCERCGGAGGPSVLDGICPTCLARDLLLADSAPPAGPLSPGTVFQGYEIVDVLGRGGMGIVYRASQRRLGRTVALKILSPRLADSEEFVDRFRREARLLASIDHPNVVRVHDFGAVDGVLYLALELVEGETLAELLARGPVAPAKLFKLLAGVCDGLGAVHRAGLVHRDIKPANILIPREGEPKVSDFGLATRVEDGTRLTETGSVLGTPHFISPEQVRGEVIDGRSDFYSLGVILYQGLSGRLPFEGASPGALLIKHLEEPPPPLPTGLPSGAAELVRSLLSKVPGGRPPDAAALKAALIRLDGRPASARRRLWIPLGAAGLLLAVWAAAIPRREPVPVKRPPISIDIRGVTWAKPAPTAFGWDESARRLFFNSNGTGHFKAAVPLEGEYELRLAASGNPARGVGAEFVARVDQRNVGAPGVCPLSGTLEAAYSVMLAAGEHEISVTFTNDDYKAGEYDRNLYLHAMSLAFVKPGAAPRPPRRIEGLVAHFPLSETHGMIVDVVGGAVAVRVGLPATAPGAPPTWKGPAEGSRRALVGVDGPGGFEIRPHGGLAELVSSPRTFAAWVKLDERPKGSDARRRYAIVSKGEPDEGLYVDAEGRFGLARGSSTAASSPIPDVLGRWHHVCGVVDPVRAELRLYVDGVFAARAADPGGSDPAPWRIGFGESAADGGPRGQMKGVIGDVRFYRRALADDDVAAIALGDDAAPEARAEPAPPMARSALINEWAPFVLAPGISPVSRNLSLIQTGDGAYVMGQQAGRPAIRLIPNAYSPNRYLYFMVRRNAIGTRGPLELDVEYLDAGTGTFGVEFDGERGIWTNSGRRATLTSSGQWKTATFTLADPRFDGRQNEGADFRLTRAPGADLWIHRVALRTPAAGGARVVETPLVGSAGGGPFWERDGGLLVGLRLTDGPWGNWRGIRSVQGIYQRPDGTVYPGRTWGSPQGEILELIAPRGYAVGGLLARGASRTAPSYNSILWSARPIFMKVKPDGRGLDPATAVDSVVRGDTLAGEETRIGGDGTPVRGLHGRGGLAIDALGLIQISGSIGAHDLGASGFSPASAVTPQEDGLIGRWALDDLTVSHAWDGSGAGAIGLLDPKTFMMSMPGFRFGGGAITLAAWIRREDQASPWKILTLGDAVELGQDNKGGVSFRVGSGGVEGRDLLRKGEWTHVAATWDGASARLFKNGVLVVESRFAGTRAPGVGLDLGSAQRALRDLRVYDRALSASELAALLTPRKDDATSTPGLIDKTTEYYPQGGAVVLDPGHLSSFDETGRLLFRVPNLMNPGELESPHRIAIKPASYAPQGAITVPERGRRQVQRRTLRGLDRGAANDVDVHALALDPFSDQLWALSGERLLVLNAGGTTSAAYPHQGRDIVFDPTGKAFWVAGEALLKVDGGGDVLARFSPGAGRFTSVCAQRGVPGVWAVLRAEGDAGRLLRVDGEGKVVVDRPLKDVVPIRVAAHKDGTVWVVDARRALLRFSEDGTPTGRIPLEALAADVEPATGHVWAVTPEELLKLDGKGRVLVRARHAARISSASVEAMPTSP